MASEGTVNDFSLSRWPDLEHQQLASRLTYSIYGRVRPLVGTDVTRERVID
jgi:DNA polymerase I